VSIVTNIQCDACGRNSAEPSKLRVAARTLRVDAKAKGWLICAGGLRDGSGAGVNDFCGECYAAAPPNYSGKNQNGFKYSVIKPAKKKRVVVNLRGLTGE
jgi:hypothetical protein